MRPAWGHRRSDLWYQRGRDCAGIYKQGRRHILDEILSCEWVLLEVVQKGRLPRHRDVYSIQQQIAFALKLLQFLVREEEFAFVLVMSRSDYLVPLLHTQEFLLVSRRALKGGHRNCPGLILAFVSLREVSR